MAKRILERTNSLLVAELFYRAIPGHAPSSRIAAVAELNLAFLRSNGGRPGTVRSFTPQEVIPVIVRDATLGLG